MTNKISIYIDFDNLGTYVGLEATLALVDDLNLEVDWQPVAGILHKLSNKEPSANMKPSASKETQDDPLAAYKARRSKAKEAFELAELKRNCQRLGISMDRGARRIEGTQVHVGLLFLNKIDVDPSAYIQAVYRAVFQGDEIELVQDVSRLMSELGLDGSAYAAYAEAGIVDWEAHQAQLLEQGIFDSPAYVIDGERFQGRQHLPLVRWHLGGKLGSPPV